MEASKYKKHTHREHILELPDTYIGSTDTHEEGRWTWNSSTEKMAYRHLAFNPGFYKLFDEILVNARDALVRSTTEKGRTPIKHIDVTITESPLTIQVENDGDGIPIEEHPEYKVYAPELIFGQLLTSGNYDKGEDKIVGGKNGYGAKLTNIFSNRFVLETRSPKHGQKYSQTWTEHMAKASKPSIKADKGQKGFVKITYEPDTTRFQHLNVADMIAVMHTRVIEIAALAGKDVKVSWNGTTIGVNTFEKYVKTFVQSESAVAYERCSDRWEVACVLTKNLFDEDHVPDEKHVSFVNGINTRKGGKHVDTIVRVLMGDFCELAAKKKVAIKPGQLKDSVVFFLNATIVNPAFDSQTKETLTTPAAKFGSTFKTDGKLVAGLVKLGLLDEAMAILDAKANRDAKKTDGSKKKTLRGMPKLVDALHAGTAKSAECTLILTEGDSAASSAIAGLAVVGREAWGVFPLRGKLLNVRDVSADKFSKNEEITAIKKILGLEQSKVYKDLKSLRYGRVMVMADQDLDGSHIKGLLMNLFHVEWPSLMQAGFLCSLATPLLKATRRGGETMSFYSAGEFEAWKTAQGGAVPTGWHLKYYKGLGTSTEVEAQDWFRNICEIKYEWDGSTNENMSLAFSKKRADDRKSWLSTHDPQRNLILDKDGRVSYSRFIHDELIHYSNADNIRSLPSIMDGLKPSQRKILFACMKRGLHSEIRVAQLAGYVSEHASYHHGEASLNAAITSMAQTFVGANNVNLLRPVGQFGTRLLGGKDAASARYIHTHLESIAGAIFRKEDASILEHIDDDGLIVEPKTYYPVVPLLLINGCIGIGTGFSTDIPPHNPEEIVGLLKDRLEGRRETLDNIALRPWWLGFKGPVEQVSDGVWQTRGIYTMDDEKKMVSIVELPVGTWTNDYKAFLDELCTNMELDAAKTEDGKPVLKNFDDLYNHVEVRFDLYLDPDYYDDIAANRQEFEKRFRLASVVRTSNMVCFDVNSNIKKYGCVGDMMEEFYVERVRGYVLRRTNEMDRLKKDAVEHDAKARFIRAVLEGTLELRRAADEDIVLAMQRLSLPPLSNPDAPTAIEAYEYLLRMRMDRVKASAVIEQEQGVERSKAAIALLEGTTPEQMWLKDLDEFQAEWSSARRVREEGLADVDGKKRSSAKKKFQVKKRTA